MQDLIAEINSWWAASAALGRASVLMCYSFGRRALGQTLQ